MLDTNVLIAAFISRGHSHDLVEHLARHHSLFTSEFILGEFREKLTTKFRMPPGLINGAEELQRSRAEIVEPAPISGVVRDPDDDAIIGTAVAAAADCLITGDGDLLALGSYQGIAIITPASFWAME